MTKTQFWWRIIFVIVALIAWGGTVQQAYDMGQNKGISLYHGQCYNIGGIIIDEQGRAIGCKPIGLLNNPTKKELDKNLVACYNSC
jgi:hypothetical protein